MRAGAFVLSPAVLSIMAPASGAIPGVFWHRKLLAGRVPPAGAADQADISFTVARSQHLAVGDTLRVVLPGAGRRPVPFVFHIAGIDAAPGEFPPQYGAGIDMVWATPAFARQGPFAVTAPSTPADLVNFGQLQDLPLLLGLSLGVLAVLTIAHLLLTSVRRRRRDLAILRALGFTGRQVRAAVSWMAVTVAAVALAIGVPVGLLCGREIWRFLAAQLGIHPAVALPLLSLLALAAAGLALAVAVAPVPGAAAARPPRRSPPRRVRELW